MTLAVVAVGGNAISPPKDTGLAAMKSHIVKTAARLADLVEAGYELVVTQVVVDPADPAFKEPTKPVGPVYESEQEIVVLRAKGWRMVKDPRGGWRRVVPSPRPLEIVEKDVIAAILKAGDHALLIAAGGGGIPVVRRGNGFHGVEAVVDKDLASAVLAKGIRAELFVIITDVSKVALRYGKPDAVNLDRLTPAEARHHLQAGEFPAGSMGPKIEVIADLDTVLEAVSGRAGTTIA
ncbi:MAG: hypothetical protein E6K17_09720 [Methanobacteriota archaeon]|nr:MAG: hypothetical protein E6K17_09720 [Euryarchaeota archaeon]